MGLHDAIAWTPKMDLQVGTMSDARLASLLGIAEERVRYRRIKLRRPSFRSTRGELSIPCAACARPILRKSRDVRRSKRLFCSKDCADASQKKRDTDLLRYGKGWKRVRALVRARDATCRACGLTPRANGAALAVHHLKPFRFGGSNHPSNLVALCESCHHTIEAVTTSALESIRIDVSLAGSFLTIAVESVDRWRGSVAGAVSQTARGSRR